VARRKAVDFDDPRAVAAAILADAETLWLPIRHLSPACAAVVARRIRKVRPAAVLIEGPDDATDLIPHLLDPASAPPLAVLSTYADEKNRFGQNGILSPDPRIPVRFRSWWPLLASAPEYAALVAGREVGAELAFIDAPLPAHIPFEHARLSRAVQGPTDGALAENAYFHRLQGRRRSFGEWWESAFESAAAAADSERFLTAVLVFAAAVRALSGRGALEDGSAVREAHMAWHLAQVRKRHPGAVIAVVTGAFHTVALPWTAGKRAGAKADRYSRTLACAWSNRGLAALLGDSAAPAWGDAVWAAFEAGEARPYAFAAQALAVVATRVARIDGGASTAEAVAAATAAESLAALRGNREPTSWDFADALRLALRKGEQNRAAVEHGIRAARVGRAMGRLSGAAGAPPLVLAWNAEAKEHRLDVSGAEVKVRLDVRRQEAHRKKSAFLHQSRFLELPVFGDEPFRGPDPARGEDLHLLGETWTFHWREAVVEHLVELADRGPTPASAAESVLSDRLAEADGDSATTAALVMDAARMGLREILPRVLDAAEAAVQSDPSFERRVAALGRYAEWHAVRDVLPTFGSERLAVLIGRLYLRTALDVPTLAGTHPDHAEPAVEQLRALLRHALSLEADRAVEVDRQPLVEGLARLAADPECPAALVGAALGLGAALGAVTEAQVARVLSGFALGDPARAGDAGRFLDGLLRTSRGILLGGSVLLSAIDALVVGLDWERFHAILPDLRRAFTAFVPVELQRLSERVAGEVVALPAGDPPEELRGILLAASRAAERAAEALRAGG
jgi:hypothetical protein